jgi:glycosyltransferase involved in cell wall biosynthesis
MEGAPAFTIVTKAFNEQQRIADALRSAQAQTSTGFELVVVDDGSRDATAEVVAALAAEDPRIRLVSHGDNRGVAAALNTGLREARAPLVALLDADDLYMPEYLSRMGRALEARPEAAFAFTDAWWLDEASGRFFLRTTSEYLDAPASPPGDALGLLSALLRGHNWLFGLTTFRREAALGVGGFDESLEGAEDFDMWLRLLAAGHGAAHAGPRLAIQRDRPGSLSKDRASMLRSLRSIYGNLADMDTLPAEVRALARERLAEVAGGPAGSQGAGGMVPAARHLLGNLRKRLAPGTVWHSETPPEVAAAFPELARTAVRKR